MGRFFHSASILHDRYFTAMSLKVLFGCRLKKKIKTTYLLYLRVEVGWVVGWWFNGAGAAMSCGYASLLLASAARARYGC
jgi:hypothetical protein